MKDCRVELIARDGKVDMEAERVSLEDLTTMCGVLQVITAKEALARGVDLDTVKNKLLDVYLAAMQGLGEEEA